MTEQRPGARPDDAPWNDSPADSDHADPEALEPAPAEVVGDEDGDDLRDVSHPGLHDPYHRDTLDERLAEELPDRPRGGGGVDDSEWLVAAEEGDADLEASAGNRPDPLEDPVAQPAEEAAVHLVPRHRLL